MNHIHRLKQDIRTRDAVIQAALTGMADLRRYCESDKYVEPCATMNPADVLLRLDETVSAMTDAESCEPGSGWPHERLHVSSRLVL